MRPSRDGPFRVAAVTCADFPDLEQDWPLLRSALAGVGIEASPQIWTDERVDWAAFSLVVVRSSWDDYLNYERFTAWARAVEEETRIVNGADVLAWNLDKSYLADLAADGVPGVPTTWVRPGDRWNPPDGEFVVKPARSAGGYETARYGSADRGAASAHVRRLQRGGSTVMVQPYVHSVDEVGEVALVYFGGEYSHAFGKGPLLRPGAGVIDRLWEQERIEPVAATPAQLRAGRAALAAAERRVGPMGYARADLVESADRSWLLLELELVDPSLYLDLAPGSAERFAEVLRRQLHW